MSGVEDDPDSVLGSFFEEIGVLEENLSGETSILNDAATTAKDRDSTSVKSIQKPVISTPQVIIKAPERREIPEEPKPSEMAAAWSNQSIFEAPGHGTYNHGYNSSNVIPHPPPLPPVHSSSSSAVSSASNPFTFSSSSTSTTAPKPPSDKKFVRKAAGEVWVDETLTEWPDNDFRIFVGDLGIECTEQMLVKEFQTFKSFAKAKIIRNTFNKKTRGYGFLSFLDPFDCAKALREKQGKYLAGRPMKLMKSTWKDRDIKEVKKKEVKKRKMEESLGLA